jgi:nitroreductase
MNLEDTIYKRQSTRSYDSTPLDNETLDEIRDFIDNAKELNPNIKWSYEILPTENISTMMRWKAPHYIAIFSEEKENFYQNVGFIFQQVDLFLQSKGIGTCWIGMGSPKNYKNPDDTQKFIIIISVGKPKGNLYREIDQFRRKSLEDISDKRDERLAPAQFAPSASNSQPWYFTHNDDGSYNLYRNRPKFRLNKKKDAWNQIDMGIALAHMYVANQDTFRFNRDDSHEELKDKVFEGRFTI